MAYRSNGLIKGLLVVLFIGAVFAGLNYLLEGSSKQPEPTMATIDNAVPEDPAIAEARKIGREIGMAIGEGIGRRIGEQLMADQESGQTDFSGQNLETTMLADASMAEESVAPEDVNVAETEYALSENSQVPSEETTPIFDEESPGTLPEADPSSSGNDAELSEIPAEPEPAVSEIESAPKQSQSELETPANKKKAPQQRDSNWWAKSVNGKGLRVVHIGQSVGANGQKGISIIFSDSLEDNQDVRVLISATDSAGNALTENWRIAPHRKSLYFDVPGPGTYTLKFDPALKDINNHTLGMDLSGNITIP